MSGKDYGRGVYDYNLAPVPAEADVSELFAIRNRFLSLQENPKFVELSGFTQAQVKIATNLINQACGALMLRNPRQ